MMRPGFFSITQRSVQIPVGPAPMMRTVSSSVISEIFAAAITEKKGVIIFSPLAQGLLTGRYLNGISKDSRVKTDGRFLKESSITDEVLAKIRKLNKIAENRGQSLAQMALSWVYSHEGVTSVLIGTSKPEQITENLKMTENTHFTKEELEEIDYIALNN